MPTESKSSKVFSERRSGLRSVLHHQTFHWRGRLSFLVSQKEPFTIDQQLNGRILILIWMQLLIHSWKLSTQTNQSNPLNCSLSEWKPVVSKFIWKIYFIWTCGTPPCDHLLFARLTRLLQVFWLNNTYAIHVRGQIPWVAMHYHNLQFEESDICFQPEDNWFSWTGKTFELNINIYNKNFPPEGQTRLTKSSFQLVNLPSGCTLLKPLNL